MVSRKVEGGWARDGRFLYLGGRVSDPKDIKLIQAVVKGSNAIWQTSKKVTSSARNQMDQFCALNKQF